MKKYLGFLIVVAFVTVMFVGCINSQPTQTVFPAQAPTPVVAITNAEVNHNSGMGPNITLKWSYPTGIIETPPVLANGIVYAGSINHIVYAFNATTGTKLWTFTTGGLMESSPTIAVADGVVYVGSYDGKLTALNAATGSKIWDYTTGGPIWWSTPAIANGVVYVGSQDHKVYALNAATGEKLWDYTTGKMAGLSPVVSDGIVYVGGDTVYALDTMTGAKIWDYTIGSNGGSGRPYYWSRPAVANGIVYEGSYFGKAYAFNAATGKNLWNYSSIIRHELWSSPALANGIVYFGGVSGKVYAFYGLNGAKLWEYPTGGCTSTPTVEDGTVYVWSADGKVYALDANSGMKLWDYTYTSFLGERVVSTPVVADGVVYVGVEPATAFGETDGIGKLIAIGPDTANKTHTNTTPGGETDMVHFTFLPEITDDGNYTTFRFIPMVNVTGPITTTYQMQEDGKAFISDRKFYDSVTPDNPVEIVLKRPDHFFSLNVMISDKEGNIIYKGGVGGCPGDGPGSGGGGGIDTISKTD